MKKRTSSLNRIGGLQCPRDSSSVDSSGERSWPQDAMATTIPGVSQIYSRQESADPARLNLMRPWQLFVKGGNCLLGKDEDGCCADDLRGELPNSVTEARVELAAQGRRHND